MRRLIIVEPPVTAAIWCRRLAVFGLLLGGIAVAGSRAGLIDPPGAVAVLGTALGFAALSVLLALPAAVGIWRTGRPGTGAVLLGLLLAGLLAAYPAYLVRRGAGQPRATDVSTDPTDPVSYSRLPRALALRRGAVHDLAPEAERRAQAAAYPDIRPLTLDAAPADVQGAALKLVKARRWAMVEAQSPAPKTPVGHIEAVARSTVMGFPEDIVIRVAPQGADGTRVDMRSASRFTGRDFGANAARVETFLSDLEDAVDEE